MPVGYLTSSTLIDTVKREAVVPTSQNLFTEADFLAIANQEMRVGLVPSILQYHQEYYVRDSIPIPLQSNKNSYPIPYRAIGGKFREVFYVDVNNNLRNMSRISPDDRPYYQQTNFQNRYIYFYISGNEIVLVPEVGPNPVGSILFSFYMRPNELVDESRVSTINNVTTTSGSGSITSITAANPSVITSASHGLSTGDIIKITGSNSTPSINNYWSVTVIDNNTFTIPANVTSPGTQGSWTNNNTIYTVDSIPSGFTTSVNMDILQTNPGHKTIAYDIKPLLVDNTNKKLTFDTNDISSFSLSPNIGTIPVVGDYIAFAGECIIPQAPSDLHDVLAQRVVMRCLQALGDANGIAIAGQKLGEMEKYTGNLIDNRSEGSATKINNIRGLLKSAKVRKRGFQ